MGRPPPPDQDVVWQWVVKGLGGCVSMLERFAPYYSRVRKDQLDELIGLMERLNILVAAIIDGRRK